MKIIALPDLHGAGIDHVEKIANPLTSADLVLLVGDLTTSGGMVDAARVIQAVQQYNTRILAVPGNWDPLEVQTYLKQLGIDLDRRHVMIDGIAFVGLGGSLAGVGAPNEFSESELDQFLADAVSGLQPEAPQILVCHQPPLNSCNDRMWTGIHVGSRSVRAYIEDRQPLICFTGHIHEGKGIDRIGRTPIVNPGPLWSGAYAFAEVHDSRVITLEIRLT